MSERNRQAEERTEDDLCIHIQVPFSFDGSDTYIEVPMGEERPRVVFTVNGNEIPADGQWHHIMFTGNANEVDELSIDGVVMYNTTLSEDEVREAYSSIPCGRADRELSQKELEVINELLANHPEIKSWWIKNNVLYLVMEDEDEKK